LTNIHEYIIIITRLFLIKYNQNRCILVRDMRIELQYFSQDGKRQDRVFDYKVEKSLTLSQLLGQLAEKHPDIEFGSNGYEMDHFLCLDGERIIHPQDDVSHCERMVIVPLVDGG